MYRYISAMLYPGGRLPAATYLVLILIAGLPIPFLHFVIANAVERTADPYGPALTCMMLCLWMQFCLTSRRLQDAGLPGGLIIGPVFLLSAVYVLALYDATIDIALIASDPNEELSLGSKVFLTIRRTAVLCWPVIWIFSLLMQPKDTDNPFGPSWDRISAVRIQRAADHAHSEHGPGAGQRTERRVRNVPVEVDRRRAPEPVEERPRGGFTKSNAPQREFRRRS
jgi:uncharacterized membrane protein YhaH (DUF805 family)